MTFKFSVTTFDLFCNIAKKSLFAKLTKNSTNLFLRGKDIISISPQIHGLHEPAITSLINWFSEEGYSDYLIDIGANIGLTSCQNGREFKMIHMFEPNPYAFNILTVNTLIALGGVKFETHNFGLGNSDSTSRLKVPRHNWGGLSFKMNTTLWTSLNY